MFASHVFWMPKAGNSPAEYEDAFWPRGQKVCDGVPARLAVADGATETSFSGLWARLLVAAWGHGRLAGEDWERALRRIRRVWRRAVGQKPLPWYAEEKLRSGAYSSLLGLTLIPPSRPEDREGTWHATAAGDSCLIQVRNNQMLSSFPFSSSEEFNSRPLLISSLDDPDGLGIEPLSISGRWMAGDTFMLMTDALAAWCLSGRGGQVLERLCSVETQAQFESLIAESRLARDDEGLPGMKNDDVTLVRCTIS
jgi:hypothetical protein